MNRKLLYLAFVGCAIATNAIPLNAAENGSKSPDSAFVCAVQGGTPTMFAYTSGEVNLKPLMSWHAEYLTPEQSGEKLCQQTAAKLQNSYQHSEENYLKAETDENNNLVCLVNEEDQGCVDEDSQKLFSVNPDYDAGCVLDNKKPIECKALTVRGIYSFGDDEPYQAYWWPVW